MSETLKLLEDFRERSEAILKDLIKQRGEDFSLIVLKIVQQRIQEASSAEKTIAKTLDALLILELVDRIKKGSEQTEP